MKLSVLGGAALALLSVPVAPALAGTVTASLSATYFEVSATSDPDFSVYSTPTVANGSSLGANGFPVATGGVNDIDAVTGELTWWSPALNAHVVETSTGTISLPYDSFMYAPNSTGTDDTNFYETAVFKGVFSLASASTVTFSLGSDDDSFIYVDGVLFGQNPGVHGVSYVEFTSPTLDAGSHSIEVFYADREHTGAALQLGLVSTGVTITPGAPEASTWAMMGLGFAALGVVGYRTRRRSGAA